MEQITVNHKTYQLVTNFKDDINLRGSFNRLTHKVYGFDFEDWYQNGYWTKRYIPYSILDGNGIVSNISVNVIDFLVNGEQRTHVQIGTVMTDQNQRKKGLSRALLEKVLSGWRGKCDLIYLFANNTVLDFYPKFGFTPVDEYQYSKAVTSNNSNPGFVQLNMSDEQNVQLLYNKVNQSTQFSTLAMVDNAPLVMFYYTSFMSQNVYFMKELDVIAIAEFNDNTLLLKDIFCDKAVPLDYLIRSLLTKEVNRVVLGFTPIDDTTFSEPQVLRGDDTLFILDDKWGLFDNHKLMFPLLSHA